MPPEWLLTLALLAFVLTAGFIVGSVLVITHMIYKEMERRWYDE